MEKYIYSFICTCLCWNIVSANNIIIEKIDSLMQVADTKYEESQYDNSLEFYEAIITDFNQHLLPNSADSLIFVSYFTESILLPTAPLDFRPRHLLFNNPRHPWIFAHGTYFSIIKYVI